MMMTFFKKINIELKAESKGFRKLKIKLEKSEQEINTINNEKLIIIEVVDSKQKILILANSPHPDISAIRQSLDLNQNFETEFYLAEKFNKSTDAYNMIILHQIPSKNFSGTSILSKILNSNIPTLFILGSQSSLQNFDNLNIGLTTGAYSNAGDEVQGSLNSNFNLFDINDEIEEIALNAPPVISTFGDYKFSANSQILFYRKVRTIETKQPLMIFLSNPTGKKNAVITGEGIWRWRIYDYQSNKNHHLFNELINSSIQYLTSREIKERFKIINEKIIPENQRIIFKAEVYDRDYKMINTSNVTLYISDSLNNKRTYTFKKSGKSFILDLNTFSSGDYKWQAETLTDGKRYKKNGIFSVLTNTTESENLRANHNILYQLSNKTNGKLFYPQEINSLISEIQKNENITPIAFSEKKTENLINYKILFFLIILLLAVEWFMRKFHGAY